MNEGLLVTNIQRFSLHDGPGIRTTVFLKGCSLRCPWCANPENINSDPQTYIKDGYAGKYGRMFSLDELVTECLKDKAFYDGQIDNWRITQAEQIALLPGGVTFSGGEALLQSEKLEPVIGELHKQRVHIAAETCLFVPRRNLEIAISSIDLFYVDIKILNNDNCRKVLMGDLSCFLNNLDCLMKTKIPVIFRIPVIGSYTDGRDNRAAVKELIRGYTPLKIELLKEHNLGESKYKSLGLEMDYHGVTDELMSAYKDELSDLDIPIEICKI